MTFKKSDVDLSTLFEPRGVVEKGPDVGYENDGVDISNIYYPLTSGGTASPLVNYRVGGVDLSTSFAGLGTVSYISEDPNSQYLNLSPSIILSGIDDSYFIPTQQQQVGEKTWLQADIDVQFSRETALSVTQNGSLLEYSDITNEPGTIGDNVIVNGLTDVVTSITNIVRQNIPSTGAHSVGPASQFNPAATSQTHSVQLDDNHIMVSYYDAGSGGNGTSIIGTLHDADPTTWGPEWVWNGSSPYPKSVALDSTHVVIIFSDASNSSHNTAILATIDGNDISFGPKNVYNAAYNQYHVPVRISDTKVAVFYTDPNNSLKGMYRIGVITGIQGDSLDFSDDYTFNNYGTQWTDAVMLDDTHMFISFNDTSADGHNIIGEIEPTKGTEFTFGTRTLFSQADTEDISCVALDSTHVAITYHSTDNISKSVIATIDGNYNITTGATSTIPNATSDQQIALVQITPTVILAAFEYGEYGAYAIGEVVGFNTFWDVYTFDVGVATYISAASMGNGKICISYEDGSVNRGTSLIITYDMPSIKSTFTLADGLPTNPTSMELLPVELHTDLSYSLDSTVRAVDKVEGKLEFVAAIAPYYTGAPIRVIGDTVVNTTITNIDRINMPGSGVFSLGGSANTLNTGYVGEKDIISLSETCVMMAYQEPSTDRGICKIGLMSNDNVTWYTGSLFSDLACFDIHLLQIDATRVMVCYKNSNGDVAYRVTTIDQEQASISVWETEIVITSSNDSYDSSINIKLLDTNRVVFCYIDYAGSDYAKAVIGDIDGLTITWGEHTTFRPADNLTALTCAILDPTHIVVGWVDVEFVGGSAKVGTIDGTAISFGEQDMYQTSNGTLQDSFSIALDSTHICIIYTYYESYAVIGTIDGTSISFGNPVSFDTYNAAYMDIVRLDINRFAVVYRDGNNSLYGTLVVGTRSGNSIGFGVSPYVFNFATTNLVTMALLGSNKLCIGYTDSGVNTGMSMVVNWGADLIVSTLTVADNTPTNPVSVEQVPDTINTTIFTNIYEENEKLVVVDETITPYNVGDIITMFGNPNDRNTTITNIVRGTEQVNGFSDPVFVGSVSGGDSSGNFTLSLSGLDIQPGDVGILAISSDNSDEAYEIEISGNTYFTWLHTEDVNNPQDMVLVISLDGSEEGGTISSVAGLKWDGTSYIFSVFRNVVKPITSTRVQGYGGMPNPPSRSGFNANGKSVVLVIGHLDDDPVASSVTAPAGYTLIDAAQYSGSYDTTTMMAYNLNAKETNDPDVFGGTGSDSWAAFTIELEAMPIDILYQKSTFSITDPVPEVLTSVVQDDHEYVYSTIIDAEFSIIDSTTAEASASYIDDSGDVFDLKIKSSNSDGNDRELKRIEVDFWKK